MVTPRILGNIYGTIEAICRNHGFIAGKSGRHMKFPYTISAKIAQFPIFHYLKNNFIWTYYPLGLAVTAYVYLKIHRLVNSDANKRSWAEQQRKQAEAAHH